MVKPVLAGAASHAFLLILGCSTFSITRSDRTPAVAPGGADYLAVIAGGLRIGVPVCRERTAIRQLGFPGGKCYAVRSLPERVSDSFGEGLASSLEPVPSIVFQYVPLRDDDLTILVAPSRVEKLGLHGVPLTDNCFGRLGRVPSLREIELVRVPVTGEGLRELYDRTSLRSLFLLQCPTTAAGLAEISQVQSLDSLSITDLGLTRLRALTYLKEVSRDLLPHRPRASGGGVADFFADGAREAGRKTPELTFRTRPHFSR
jgi:hypothetical protein